MKISKSHPFYQAIYQAEKLEQTAGRVTDEVMKIRKEIQMKYPELFKEYLEAKNKKQQKELEKVKIAKAQEKTNRKIRSRSIIKAKFNKVGFGKGPRDL